MSTTDQHQPLIAEPLQFHNGADTLAGTLYRPAGSSPLPAAAFIAGSGPATREGYSSLPPIWEALARHGVASFAWDKPGVGESSGDWRSQTNEDRARETMAGITRLRQHPAIDADRVGVWGISQAGWVIPLVCAMDPRLAFVIAVSVPVGTGAEQELYRVAHCLPADGYSSEETRAAVQFTRERLALMERRAPYQQIQELQQTIKDEPWFREVGDLDPENYTFLQTNAFESPQPLLPAIECPVLAIFGERDMVVDWRQSAEVLAQTLRAAGNQGVTTRVIPGVDHIIFQSETGGMREMDRSFFERAVKPYPPEYLDLMGQWVRDHVRAQETD